MTGDDDTIIITVDPNDTGDADTDADDIAFDNDTTVIVTTDED